MATEAEIKAYLSKGELKAENEAPKSRTRVFCEHCGCEDIEVSITARWDKAEQRWEFHEWNDCQDPWCPECECEQAVDEAGI